MVTFQVVSVTQNHRYQVLDRVLNSSQHARVGKTLFLSAAELKSAGAELDDLPGKSSINREAIMAIMANSSSL